MEAERSPQFSTPKKGEEPAIPELAENIKTLQTFELKQLMAAISKEMDDIHVTHKGSSKSAASGYQPHDVSSILHSLIKEGTLSGEMLKGEASFEQ